jgi:hypothetical protein
MDSIKTLYHGSRRIIKKPEFGKGNPQNDYGLGFYCTEDLELAREWASANRRGGFANIYTIDTAELAILNLSESRYGTLDWLAVLVNNRVLDIKNDIAANAKDYLTTHFLPDVAAYDVIVGYRADDSYFAFAMDFLNNAISLRQLSRAMRFGTLGEQFVLKSRGAFDSLRFVRSEPVNGEIYYARRMRRDREARDDYLKRERNAASIADEIFMLDVLREEMRPGNARLP